MFIFHASASSPTLRCNIKIYVLFIAESCCICFLVAILFHVLGMLWTYKSQDIVTVSYSIEHRKNLFWCDNSFYVH